MSRTGKAGASANLAAYDGARLSVVMTFASQPAGAWTCRRAGFEFGKEPVEIEIDRLGNSLAQAIETIISIVTEATQKLRVVLVLGDGIERVLNEGDERPPVEAELAILRADLAAARPA